MSIWRNRFERYIENAAQIKIDSEKRSRYVRNLSRSNAELADDVERLTLQLNTERFCYIVAGICFADGIVFTYYTSITAPVCLTILETGGPFVLARYLEVGEVITLISELIRRFGKKEVDRLSEPEKFETSKPQEVGKGRIDIQGEV